MLNFFSRTTRILFLAVFAFLPAQAADIQHQLVRKIAVFPIADANFANSEEAWWQMREVLTRDQKLLVATRRFMVNRGVFQPRKSLKPADVIILSRILDAQALIITHLEDRILKMKVFESENGGLLWQSESQFHPAIPISDQIIKVSTQLMIEFTNAIPYQGYTILDESVGKLVYSQKGEDTARVFVGKGASVAVGDPVHWVEVFGSGGGRPFFDSPEITVIAEGTVTAVLGDRIEVEIKKARDFSQIKAETLVRFPKEIERLKELNSGEDRVANLGTEFLSAEMKSSGELKKNHNSTSTALAFIANIAAFILLAF